MIIKLSHNTRTVKLVTILSMWVALCGLVWLSSGTVQALPAGDTFTVTSKLDSGVGSLRQAISDANSNGNPGEQDIINFNIATPGDQEIITESVLSITEPVLIDGYTQGDAEPNTANWPEPFNGTLRVVVYNDISTGGIDIQTSDVTLRGLVINQSPTVEIMVTNGDNFVLEGSFIGINRNGYGLYKNASNQGGVMIENSDNVRIGGAEAAQRNVMGGCMVACVQVSGESGNTSASPVIQGNYIGMGIDGLTPLGSQLTGGTGIVINRYVDSPIIGGDSGTEGNTITDNNHGAIWAKDVSDVTIHGNRIYGNFIFALNGKGEDNGSGILLMGVTDSVIGGSQAARNVISGNIETGITLTKSEDTDAASENITISHNIMGYMDDGETAYPNKNANIIVTDDSNYVSITQNVLHNSNDEGGSAFADGVTVTGNAQNVSILQNSIFNNLEMGIDINGNGPTSNDTNDSDTGTNGLLNYPTYYDTEESGGSTTIYYSYRGAAGDYRIEFFANSEADSPGPGEGETYIGYDEISYDGNGSAYFSVTIPGTGHDNISLTATEVDDTSPTGFGATSEFGGVGDPPPPIVDIVAEKKLLNPEDATVGNTVNYEITIRNEGPDSIDIGDYDNSSPGVNQLFLDLLPPEATYVGATGTNISCLSAGPGSASLYGPSLADHSDHELVFCGWNGGSYVLDAGEEVKAIVSAEVVDDTEPDFTNYVTGFVQEYDPDVAVAAAGSSSGGDILTYFEQLAGNTYNNVYWTDTSISDTSVSKVLENEGEITNGTTVNYTLTFSNAGPNVADLTYYNGGGVNPVASSLFVDTLPSSMDFVASSNPDVLCVVAGPSSLAPYFEDHPDYNIILCFYVGTETELAAGQSISTTISALATEDLEEGLTNYVFTGLNEEDPDYLFNYYQLAAAASSAFGQDRRLGDFLTRMDGSNRNFAQATYDLEDPEQPGGNNSAGQNSPRGELTDTGQALILAVILGLVIVGCALELLRRSRSTYRAK